MAMILAVVDDLFFLTKIERTAQQLGVPVEPVDPSKVEERAARLSVRAVILDLNHRSGLAVEVLRKFKANPALSHIQLVGFLSHVQADLVSAAREAGCDLVLARSAFSQQLPKLLEKLAGKETAAPAGS